MIRNAFALLLLLCASSLAASRPNIVFLFADDQRADTIAAHGNKHIRTPNLDRLAANGLSFMSNYCAGSYSGAVCVASRSMLMTGRHWHRIEDTKNWQGLTTLPERLAATGYRTFAVGKWHNGAKTLGRAFQSGKSLYMGGMADHMNTPLQDLAPDGTLSEKRENTTFSSVAFANAAIDFINEQKGEQPYMLYVAFTAPHDPRNPPPAYREAYYRKRPPLPKNFLPVHPFDNGHLTGKTRDESLAPWPRERSVISDQLCEYYGLITHLDEQVGRILEAIKASQGGDNTIVIYTADHGLSLGSHGLLGKQNIYEHSMGSPLIISGPGIPRNMTTDAMSYILDLHKTILSLSGTAIPDDIDGEDLSPLFKDPTTGVRDTLFLPFQDIMRSVRNDRYKLHIYPKINHTLLFDLKNDPLEMNDLSQDPDYAGKAAQLTAILKAWQQRVGDTQPLSVANPGPKTVDYDSLERVLDPWQPEWIREKYFDGRSDVNHGN